MADPTNLPSIVSATRDANAAGNPIFIRITDGTDTVLVDASGNLQVILAANSGIDIGDVDVLSVIPGTGAANLGKAEDVAHVTGDTGVMALAVRDDTGATLSSATGDYEPLHLDASGNLRTITVIVINAEKNEDVAHVTGDVGNFVLAVRRDVATSGASADGDYASVNVNATGDVYVSLDGETVQVSANATANSSTNPIFVKSVDESVSANEVHDFNTVASIASDASSSHDYTVVGTFLLKQVHVAAAGGMKVEIQVGPLAALVLKFVHFIKPGTASKIITINPPIEVTGGVTPTVRVLRTNRSGSAQDVYSTIVGNDF